MDIEMNERQMYNTIHRYDLPYIADRRKKMDRLLIDSGIDVILEQGQRDPLLCIQLASKKQREITLALLPTEEQVSSTIYGLLPTSILEYSQDKGYWKSWANKLAKAIC